MRRLVATACLAAILSGLTPQGTIAQQPTIKPTPATHPRFPGAETSLGAQVAAITSEPGVSRAHWGVAVTTLDGTPIYGLNEGQFFQPASNAKIFTTTAAMALLGGSTTFETKVIGRGTFDSPAKLTGDVVIVGGGDANLNGRDFPYKSPTQRAAARKAAGLIGPEPPSDPPRYLAEMADQVAATGLREVHGDIVGDDTLWPYEPYPSDWSIEDTVWYYGAPISALTVADNQIDITVAPGVLPGAPAVLTVNPAARAYYTLDTTGLTTGAAKSGTHVGFDLPMGSRALRIYGTIAVDAPPQLEGIAIHDPAEYAAMAFKQLLEARGITVSGQARAQHALPNGTNTPAKDTKRTLDAFAASLQAVKSGNKATYGGCSIAFSASPNTSLPEKLLASHRSPSMLQDIQLTNKVSQNQHAELLLHQLGEQVCDRSRAAALAVERAHLTATVGLDPQDFTLFDGSGLSGHDLTTPRAFVQVLQYAAKQDWFPDWRASLPVGGEDGTLASRFPRLPLKDHVWAKTGTLGEARALSGYVQAASGRMLAFSVMVSAHNPATTVDRDAMDRIVAAIAATN